MRSKTLELLKRLREAYLYNKDVINLAYLRHRLSACILILLLVPVIILLSIHKSKSPPIFETNFQEKDYSALSWKEKADNEGYSRFVAPGLSYDYKIDIYAPKKFYIFKVGEGGRVIMRIKNLKGILKTPTKTKVVSGTFPIVNNERVISGVSEVMLSGTATYASMVGLNILSPFQRLALDTVGARFNIATVHVPSGARIIQFGDADYPAGAHKLSSRSVFFHNFASAVVVYYLEPYHTIIQIFFAFMAIGLFLLILYYYKLPITRYAITSKHFVLLLAATIMCMLFLVRIFPNPKPIILIWDDRNVKYNAPHTLQVTDDEIPNYLTWVIAITRTADAIVIGQTTNIGEAAPQRNRIYYLIGKSVKKIYILDEYKNTYAARFFTQLDPKKTEVVSANEIPNKLEHVVFRRYPYEFLWPAAVKIIVFLSFIIFTFSIATIFMAALEIRSISQAILFFSFSILYFFFLMGIYIIVGMIEHMPIGYHAGNTMGVILTNYFMPGAISGGNLIRTASGALGSIIVIFFTSVGYRKIDVRLFLLPIFLFLILVLNPATEYSAKRFLLTTTSAEADVWDYKLEGSFDMFSFFREIRDGPKAALVYLQSVLVFNANVYYSLGISEKLEGEYQNAIDTFKTLILRSHNEELTTRSYYELGQVYKDFVQFLPTTNEDEKAYSVLLAAKNYISYLEREPNGALTKSALFNLIAVYAQNGKFLQANDVVRTFLLTYKNDALVPVVKFLEAENYQRALDYENAAVYFEEFIKLYPVHDLVLPALLFLADDYTRIRKPLSSIDAYQRALGLFPDPNFARSILTSLVDQYLLLDHYRQQFYGEVSPIDQIEGSKKYEKELSANLYEIRKTFTKAAALEETGEFAQAAQLYNSVATNNKNNLFGGYAQTRLADLHYLLGFGLGQQTTDVQNMYHEIRQSQLLPQRFAVSTEREKTLRNFHMKASLEYSDLMTHFPEFIDHEIASFRLADSLYRTESDKSAITILEQLSLSLNLRVQTGALLDLARINTQLGLLDEALDYYKRAIASGSVTGINKEVYNEIAILHEKKGDTLAAEIARNDYRETMGLPRIPLSTAKAAALTFWELFNNVTLSRGMLSYFLGIAIMIFLPFLPKSIMSITALIVTISLSRGLIRIAEQDPFRAVMSIWPGIKLAFTVNALIIGLGLLFTLAMNMKKILIKLGIPLSSTQPRVAKF